MQSSKTHDCNLLFSLNILKSDNLNPYLTVLVDLLEDNVLGIVVNYSTHPYYYASYHWLHFIPAHNK